MPKDMCEFSAAHTEAPRGPVVFDYNDTLVLADETLGRRLLLPSTAWLPVMRQEEVTSF